MIACAPLTVPFRDNRWGLDHGPRHQVEAHCDGKATAVRTKTERRAARAPEAAYHEVRLADLIEHVAEKWGRYRAGEVDGYAVDEAIHHYDRASQELGSSACPAA